MSHISHYTVLTIPESEGKGVSLKASVHGQPPESGRFLLFPGRLSLRIKQLLPLPGSDEVILELKGLSRAKLNRGNVLIPEETGATEGRKALVLWKKKISSVDSMSLKLRDTANLISPDSVNCREGDKAVILSSRVPFLQIPGQIYTLEGNGKTGECLLLMSEPWTMDELKKMKARISKISNFPGEEAVISMNLRVRGAVALPPHLLDKEFDGSVKLAGWVLMSRVYDKAVATVDKRCRAEEGLCEEDLPGLLNLPARLCREVCDLLISEGKIIRKKGYLFNHCDDHRAFLSPMSRMWLDSLEEAGSEGLPLKETFKMGSRLEAMEKRGLIRVFDTFVVEEQAFRKQADSLLAKLPRGAVFELSNLKGLTDLSRSRLLLFLDALEKEGKVICNEDHQRYVAEPEREPSEP